MQTGMPKKKPYKLCRGCPQKPAPALPEHDIRTFLQPLPPGWVQNQGFSVGLHPTTDVFELDDDAPQLPAHEEEGDTNPANGENPQNARDTSQDNDTSQREACEKGGETFPDSNARETPPCEKSSEELLDAEMTGYDDDGSSSTSGDNALHDDYEALDSEDPQDPGGVPEPRGERSSGHDYTSFYVLETLQINSNSGGNTSPATRTCGVPIESKRGRTTER